MSPVFPCSPPVVPCSPPGFGLGRPREDEGGQGKRKDRTSAPERTRENKECTRESKGRHGVDKRENKGLTREKDKGLTREKATGVHKGVCEVGLAAGCPVLRSAVRVHLCIVCWQPRCAVQEASSPMPPAFGASVYCVWCTVQSILYTVYCILYSVYIQTSLCSHGKRERENAQRA